MGDQEKIEEFIDISAFINEENKKNKHKITCTKCSCLILRPSDGNFIENEVCFFSSYHYFFPLINQFCSLPKIELPVMKTNEELKRQIANGQIKSSEFELEKLKDCWCIDDIFTFENVGVSNTVDGLKYLICADCEYGPIGVHYLNNKKSYLALNRVEHKI